MKLFVSNSLERLAASYLVHKVIPKQTAALWCTYTRYDVRKFRHTLRRSTPLSIKTFRVTPKTLRRIASLKSGNLFKPVVFLVYFLHLCVCEQLFLCFCVKAFRLFFKFLVGKLQEKIRQWQNVILALTQWRYMRGIFLQPLVQVCQGTLSAMCSLPAIFSIFAKETTNKNMSITKPQNILSIQNRDEFRQWLITHNATEKECWVKVKRGRPMDDGTFWYVDAVEEAMCFGWIDSTLKRLDGEAYQRFAPRTKGSLWSELNKERCRRMDRLGRMTDAGRAVLPDMSPGGFTIDKEILSALQQDPIVWRNFQNFPPLYQRVRIDTIQIKKKQRPLFENRLKKFIDNTRLGVIYGEWNDNGRLL